MNDIAPNCIDDFLFSNPNDLNKLELILSRKLPFPFAGKSGILLHGTWGTGKSTLAALLPELMETACSDEWDMTQGIGQMLGPIPSHTQTAMFRCGGGLSSTYIAQTIAKFANHFPIHHNTRHDYFVFDEIDRLTSGAQLSLRSTMDMKRCIFFFTTNYLSKVDEGIINRCHLVEMNQLTTPSPYIAMGQRLLKKMGVSAGVVGDTTLQNLFNKSRGSLRDFTTDVVLEGISAGGSLH